MESGHRQRLLRLGARGRLFTAAEAARAGVHTGSLTRLAREGVLERVSRGQYRMAEAPPTEHHALAIVAAAVPDAVICFLSALAFHRIGTHLSHEVWVARARDTWTPSLESPPIRVVRLSGEALTAGVQTHHIEGRPVRIYSPAKTIADCFKFRNRIGLDIALEALNDAWGRRKVRMADLERFARICRVQNVMRPYLEMLVA